MKLEDLFDASMPSLLHGRSFPKSTIIDGVSPAHGRTFQSCWNTGNAKNNPDLLAPSELERRLAAGEKMSDIADDGLKRMDKRNEN